MTVPLVHENNETTLGVGASGLVITSLPETCKDNQSYKQTIPPSLLVKGVVETQARTRAD